MLNILSIIVGLIAGLMMLPAILPVVGWLTTWLMFPVAGIGLVLGLLSSRTSGRNINLVILVLGILRVMLPF